MNKKPKLAYIGSSHHLERTRSAHFIVEVLKQSYEVTFFLTDHWTRENVRTYFEGDSSYEVVFFFQSVPDFIVPLLTCPNLVYCPMYDQSGSDRADVWLRYKNFKILCFSRALWRKLRLYGFQVLAAQFFPDPAQYPDGGKSDPASVFFWPRRPEIQWSMVKKLFPLNFLRRVHIHTACDWGVVELPDTKASPQFTLTTSDWFSSNDEYLQLVSECDFFVAPRLAEGIGFSFLEAMAMGKIVIAANKPTMNEYIQNKKTGFLFDPQRPKPIKFGNLEAIKKNLEAFMAVGRKQWLEDQKRILQFMGAPYTRSQYHFLLARLAQAAIVALRFLKRSVKGQS